VDAASIDAGQQANSLTKSSSFNIIHTLACLYAAQGKTTEARQLLLDGMAAANLAEPNSAVWLGFGYIYEQFGADGSAIAAYRKVTKPESTPIDPTDPWVLAQAHLKSLHAD
jgi:Tfp pilus assembly protein PilF